MTARIRVINLDQFAECLKGLSRLLVDAVNSGASVGFWAPMDEGRAILYWREVLQGMVQDNRVVIVAEDGGEIVGSVQLVLSDRENGHHRAEVTKLMVHTSRRADPRLHDGARRNDARHDVLLSRAALAEIAWPVHMVRCMRLLLSQCYAAPVQ